MATTNLRKSAVKLQVDIGEFLDTEYSTCMMCSGFYSNNFGQPICGTCHLFLFSYDINKDDDEQEVYTEKADSDDSGNEEPDAAADFYTKKDKTANVIKSHSYKMDKLTERISSLTIARDSEKECIPEGLVDSLPPEVLLVVFRHLDDISRWMAGNVCSRWWQILDAKQLKHNGNILLVFGGHFSSQTTRSNAGKQFIQNYWKALLADIV